MLRRFFGSDTTKETLGNVNELFRLAASDERNLFVLETLCETLTGDVRGFIIMIGDTGQGLIDLSKGYSRELKNVSVKGVWQDSSPHLVPDVHELFSQSSIETLQALTETDVFAAKATLLSPIKRQHLYGLLVLQRFDGKLSESDLETASGWATLLASSHDLRNEASQAQQSLVEFTKAFMEAIEAQDFKQLGHSERVTQYALALGRAKGLSRQDLLDLYFAAMLHDVGKLGSGLELAIEDPLHPQRGANMLASSVLLAKAREAIRAHHEHWDGSGFPQKLLHEQIPLLARIVAVADTFDFLSSERGQALPLHEVEKALQARAGKYLDPDLVKLFNDILREGKSTKVLTELNERELF